VSSQEQIGEVNRESISLCEYLRLKSKQFRDLFKTGRSPLLNERREEDTGQIARINALNLNASIKSSESHKKRVSLQEPRSRSDYLLSG